MGSIEKEYMKIGKAIIDECIKRWDERCITIPLSSVQYHEKLFIRMEDRVEPLSIWKYRDLHAVCVANRRQRIRAREAVDEIETIFIALLPKSKERELPKVVKVE